MGKNKGILQQFIKFGAVGVTNTLIHTICYNIALAFGANDFVGQIIGFLISSVNGFLLNKKFVFNKTNTSKKMILKYYTTYIVSFVLTMLMTYIYVDILKINTTIHLFGMSIGYLPILTLIVTVPVNFILSRYWVYK